MNLVKKNIFLIDGLGGIVSALLLGIVLPLLTDFIAMPKQTLIILAAIALLYAAYSLSCHFISPTNKAFFLKIIIAANLIYSCMTIGYLYIHSSSLNIWDFLYFSLEVIVILVIVNLEMRTLKQL